MLGTHLHDRYRIDALLGEGGMGTVYRAHDTRLRRDVVVKVVRDGTLDAEARGRLLHEARAAAGLNHPGIVAVYDAGESAGTPFVVMEYVEGSDLRHQPELSASELLALGRALCEALGHAHAHGVVHRDLKPENVLVPRAGGVAHAKIADLGLAVSRRLSRLTQAEALVGTAWYLSPEQALGRELDGRADLYALGVMLYERATGRLPFVGEDPIAVISQHLYAPVVPPRTWRESMPPSFEPVILRLLAKQPEDRFADAREVLAALAEVRPDETAAPAAAEETSDRVRMLDRLARGQLVGRRSEVAQLREQWNRAMQGRGQLVLLSGEPGSGKTRLAREVAVMARLHGAEVLTGGCYEFEATTPYLPFVEALRRWVEDQPPAALRDHLGAAAAGLARLAPGIEEKLGAQPPEPSLTASEERLRLFDHVARWLRALAAERGVLLWLDDLHWADHGTLALLHYLLRQLGDQRVLALGAYREVELDRAHPLSTALVEWNRERIATRIALGRLTAAETSAQLAAMFGQETVSPDFAAIVFRETEGNPFFVEEVVKALIDHGQIYRGEGAWQRLAVDELTVPQSVKAAIGRRLDRLSPACTEVLHAAAALGKVFEFRELAAVSDAGEDPLLDALDEAVSAQLVRAESGERFAFTHDKIREVLHEELNPIRRRRLHLRVGERLEALHGAAIERHVDDLAFHFAEAGELRKALDYLARAAEAAERVDAHDEALGFLDRAVECAEGLEQTDTLASLQRRIATIHQLRGDYGEAARRFGIAAGFERDPARRVALQALQGAAYSNASDPRGVAVLEEALRALDPATQARERAVALTMLARYHHYELRHAESLRLLEQARGIAEALGDPKTLDTVYMFIAGALQHLGRYRESNEVARANVALGERESLLYAIAHGHEFLSENYASTGEWEESLRHSRVNAEVGQRIGSRDRLAWSAFAECYALTNLGRLREAIEAAERGIAIARTIGEHRVQTLFAAPLGQALVLRGRIDEALALTTHASAEALSLGQPFIRGMVLASHATALAADGRLKEALDELMPTAEELRASENRNWSMGFGALLARLLIEDGRLDTAADYLAVLREVATANEASTRVATADAIGARIAAERGDREGALRALDRAIPWLERSGTRIELSRALAARGGLRARAGDGLGAREDFATARTTLAACGADREVALTEAAARAAGVAL